MTDAESVRAAVLREIREYLEEEGRERTVLEPGDGLLENGLDSLGLAVLATRLEDVLGYDPFLEWSQDAYPRTVGELVDVYARSGPAAVGTDGY